MSAESVAAAHQRRRKALAKRAADEIARLWAKVDRTDIARSWAASLPAALTVLGSAQAIAAASAGPYLDDLAEAYDVPDDSAPRVRVDGFAGTASDGRDLASLLYQPAITALMAIKQGATTPQALASGQFHLDMITRTQVADAGRAADGVALTARTRMAGYVRVLSPPSCSRCAILAGRFYRWNAGFNRHPRCDCTGMPVASAAAAEDHLIKPRAYFDSLDPAEQDRVFTQAGAQAIRDGADIGQVVNARRKAAGLSTAGGGRGRLQRTNVFGRQLFTTTEGTTRRGFAGQTLGGAPRLMPESIYEIAGNDRAEAIRLLRRNGYLLDARPATVQARRLAAEPRVVRHVEPSAPKPIAPIAAPPKTLAERVKAGIADRRVLSGGQNAVTELLTLSDGSKVVFKKARAIEGTPARFQQDAEELAPLVLRAAGLRAPEIYRPSANQLYMEYLDGSVAANHLIEGTFQVDPAAYDADEGLLLGMVDQITDNYDRNAGNFLISNRHVLGIDHGFAFSYTGGAESVMVARDKPAAAFHGDRPPFIGQWADNDLSPADVALVRTRLRALRPEFERLGRGDWLDKSLIRLAQIERHATGTKRRIR